MIVRRIYETQLAQSSYLIGCSVTREALIVDPNRDVESYMACATEDGLRITAVAETHIHADFVSGARELAHQTGATLYLSDAGPAAWSYAFVAEAGISLLRDGDSFCIGRVRIEAMHTPRHSPEHLALLVTDTVTADEPIGICSGDVLFVGDVGRPDLLETVAHVAGATAEAAQQLYRSIQRLHELPDYLQLWPGHGAGSACGREIGAVPQSTIGYERRYNRAFNIIDQAHFLHAVLDSQPEVPAYWGHIKRVNQAGPRPLANLPTLEQRPIEQFAAQLDAGVLVVDVRSAEQYAAGAVPGTLNLPLGSAFLTGAGALLPHDLPFALLAGTADVAETVRRLRLIGLDTLSGYWTPAVLDAWTAGGRALTRIERIDARQLVQLYKHHDVVVVDVRSAREHAAGHIPGSINVPLTQLPQRRGELPPGWPLVMYCQGGSRSTDRRERASGAPAGCYLRPGRRPDRLAVAWQPPRPQQHVGSRGGTPMNWGLHYLLSCADTQSPAQRYRDTLEQAVAAEALGFESVWPVEQHFNRNVSILPAPALLLAAIAARTHTLRLGTAIVQLPLAHPLRIAEEIATLDVLSGGRVEFGVGRGGNATHFAGFGVPLAESRERMHEALALILRAWTTDQFSFAGRYWEVEDVALAPRPLQQPHPPIRLAVNSPETAEYAGRAGLPILVASNVNPFPKLRELVPLYRAARAEAGHPAADGHDLTILMPLYVGESRRQIEQEVAPSVRQFVANTAAVAAPWLAKASTAERPKLETLLEQVKRMTYATVNDVTGILDTPDACVERLGRVQEEFRPERIIGWFNFGGLIPHTTVMRSMELFAATVMAQL